MGRTAKYVLDQIERLLGPAEREKCFDWARGDVSPKTQRAAHLPFDAVWEARKLIVEIDEDQHGEATLLFDKPDRVTVSGVDRGKQRKLYDDRKREAARLNGYTIVAIQWSRKRKQSAKDLDELRNRLSAAGVSFEVKGETR